MPPAQFLPAPPAPSTPRSQTAGAVVAEYRPRLKAFIRSRVKSAEDAEDILQDVFYQFARVDQTLNPIEQTSAWLYRVARNMIHNFRIKRREQSLPAIFSDENGEMLGEVTDLLLHEQQTPEDEYLRSLLWEELYRALDDMPVEQRDVFERTEFLGMPVKLISEDTGIPAATLLSRKHYAVTFLRKRLIGLYLEMLEA